MNPNITMKTPSRNRRRRGAPESVAAMWARAFSPIRSRRVVDKLTALNAWRDGLPPEKRLPLADVWHDLQAQVATLIA